jgi:HAD superfamily 5'-nucleotidase-like hydrolase
MCTLTFPSPAARLVHELHYPPLLLEKTYDPSFAIRGLHFDLRSGILLKLTFLGDVVSGAAYLGRRPLDDAALERIYPGMHIPQAELQSHFKHYVEPCALVDTTLVADIIHLFETTGRPYHPHYVHMDVSNAVAATLREDIPHKLATTPETVLQPKQVHDLLLALRATGRRTFLLTNSEFAHVDVVMRHLCGHQMAEPERWPETLFDVVICSAGRPGWFKSDVPFRSFNAASNKVRWLPVTELRSGHVYVGGSVTEMMRLIGGSYRDVLYTSALPHVTGADCYADLSLPSTLGWRTGAIVAEVDREVESVGSARYKAALVKLLDLERSSTAEPHAQQDAAGQQDLLRQRDELKAVLNRHFGSAFRSLNGHTYFAHQLLRNTDIYMGRCEALRVITDHFLRPLRRSMPHEPYV